jgi:hypothetical protein
MMHTPLVVRLAPRSPGGDFMWHERLEKDTKVGEDYKKIVITSIFLAESVAE